MTDNTDSMIPEILRRLQEGQAESRRQHEEVVTRLTYIERAIDRLVSFRADTSGRVTETQALLDKLTARVERIERRLELDA
jgi:hypothetical protein